MSKRGYWGIVLFEPKYICNAGSLVRSARCFGASFICTVGQRYTRTAEDTASVFEHFPGFHFDTLAGCLAALPKNCAVVRVEVDGNGTLGIFNHPQRVAYFFGGEDRTLPDIKGSTSVKIPTKGCLNLAVAAGCIMYDRERPPHD